MILTSTMIKEDATNPPNQKLAGYNDFLRQLARAKKCVLADLNAAMQAALIKGPGQPKGNQLTTDGVHMNALGNIVMALGVLEGFGLDQDQLARCRADFESMPDSCSVRLAARLSAKSYRKLQAVAAQRGVTVQELLAPALAAKIDALLGEK